MKARNFISKSIIMVKPTNFQSNQETILDNKFMLQIHNTNSSINKEIREKALEEFENLATKIKEQKINITIYDQYIPEAYDSVFPNNWFFVVKKEYLPEGLLFIFPVKYKTRRMEKNPEIIRLIKDNVKYFEDLSYLEDKEEYLESTGCLIFDHINRRIYVSISERANEEAVEVFLSKLNYYLPMDKQYRLVKFYSYQDHYPIYHTNVMMSVLEKHIVICLESIKDKEERIKVLEECSENRIVIEISREEMNEFCANIINIRNNDDEVYLIGSECAYNGFNPQNRKILEESYKILYSDIGTIEKIGGGSARCMIAESY
jgi:hypothetical protein